MYKMHLLWYIKYPDSTNAIMRNSFSVQRIIKQELSETKVKFDFSIFFTMLYAILGKFFSVIPYGLSLRLFRLFLVSETLFVYPRCPGILETIQRAIETQTCVDQNTFFPICSTL